MSERENSKEDAKELFDTLTSGATPLLDSLLAYYHEFPEADPGKAALREWAVSHPPTEEEIERARKLWEEIKKEPPPKSYPGQNNPQLN